MQAPAELRAALEPMVRESFEPKIMEALDAAVAAAVNVISPTTTAPKKRGHKSRVAKEGAARIGRGLPPKTDQSDES